MARMGVQARADEDHDSAGSTSSSALHDGLSLPLLEIPRVPKPHASSGVGVLRGAGDILSDVVRSCSVSGQRGHPQTRTRLAWPGSTALARGDAS